jgi:hypothetical protein
VLSGCDAIRITAASLEVSVQVTDLLGQQRTVPVALINAGSDWQPTGQIPGVANLLSLPLLSDGNNDGSFQFTPLVAGGDWAIDDVYLDPFKTS